MTPRLAPHERKIGYWLNVERADGDGCWLWVGQVGSAGYGQCSFRGRTMMAHRASWIMTNGEIPDGLLVCHKCDVRNCVRPDHLFLGTHADNMADMYAKGRGPTGLRNGSQTQPERRAWGDRNGSRLHPEKRTRGDAHWTRRHPERLRGSANANAKLSDLDVSRIRKLCAAGVKQALIAECFGVSQAHVSRLACKKQRVDDSEVYDAGENAEGELVLQAWFAAKEGLS